MVTQSNIAHRALSSKSEKISLAEPSRRSDQPLPGLRGTKWAVLWESCSADHDPCSCHPRMSGCFALEWPRDQKPTEPARHTWQTTTRTPSLAAPPPRSTPAFLILFPTTIGPKSPAQPPFLLMPRLPPLPPLSRDTERLGTTLNCWRLRWDLRRPRST